MRSKTNTEVRQQSEQIPQPLDRESCVTFLCGPWPGPIGIRPRARDLLA